MKTLSLVVDTAPDIATGRRLYGIDDLSDEDCLNVMYHRRRQMPGGDDESLAWHLLRITGLACAVLDDRDLTVESFLLEDRGGETALLAELFDRLASVDRLVVCSQRRPGLDLVRGRALIHAVPCPGGGPVWPPCDCLDLVDVLGDVPCDELALAIGLPPSGDGLGDRARSEGDALRQLAIERRVALLEGRTTVVDHREAFGRIADRLDTGGIDG